MLCNNIKMISCCKAYWLELNCRGDHSKYDPTHTQPTHTHTRTFKTIPLWSVTLSNFKLYYYGNLLFPTDEECFFCEGVLTGISFWSSIRSCQHEQKIHHPKSSWLQCIWSLWRGGSAGWMWSRGGSVWGRGQCWMRSRLQQSWALMGKRMLMTQVQRKIWCKKTAKYHGIQPLMKGRVENNHKI